MSTVTLNRARLAPPEFTRRRLQQQMQQQASDPAPVPGHHLPAPTIEALARRAEAAALERSRVTASTAGR